MTTIYLARQESCVLGAYRTQDSAKAAAVQCAGAPLDWSITQFGGRYISATIESDGWYGHRCDNYSVSALEVQS